MKLRQRPLTRVSTVFSTVLPGRRASSDEARYSRRSLGARTLQQELEGVIKQSELGGGHRKRVV